MFRSIRHGRLGERLADPSVAKIVKQAVARAGLDPRNFAGHSLRSVFATCLAGGRLPVGRPFTA